MAWLEMSRDPEHGGTGWEFGVCLWSPTERAGGGAWGYWDLMARVREGDAVLHLRGKNNPQFVGHSIADADCQITSERPPSLGTWGHAERFYRVPLRDYLPLEPSISLSAIFQERREELATYRREHSPVTRKNGRLLFYVEQAGRLQCQNGAYLSEVDSELAAILFGQVNIHSHQLPTTVSTSSTVSVMQARIGQQAFSDAIRKNYSSRCCFPLCSVAEQQFLVGAHIARWSDSPEHRGQISNGLCLCLMHDKAFERGLFSVSAEHQVLETPLTRLSEWAVNHVIPFVGQYIGVGPVLPDIECLRLHWKRIGLAAGSPTYLP